MATYDFVFNAIGLRDWCDAAKAGNERPMSMAELLAKSKGQSGVETSWWEFPFPSLDALNKACAAFPQSRDVTVGVEKSFLAIKDSLRFVFDPMTQPLSWALEWALALFQATPWWIMIPILMAIVYFASKSVRLVFFVAACIAFLAFIDHYDHAIQTLAIIFVCAFLCVVLGVPIGIAMSRSDSMQRLTIPILDMLQTLPPFVYLIPLIFLFLISFWLVKNYRMVPGFDTINWVKMFSKGYFWDAYWRTLGYAGVATVVTSILAFPCAFALAFKVSPKVRRWALFFLIVPFFTSYLVRAYSWQIFLNDNGIFNTLFALIGLGPFQLLNNFFGTLVGYLTLCLPLVVVLQLISLANVDRTLIEAAHNLGCGRLRTVFQVIIPLAKIGIILGAVFTFILSFG